MWIIPKNISDTFHFAVDTKELGLDSEEFTQTCEKSLMWRSKLSQSPTWLRRWKRIKYLQHLSGRILKPSHTKSFLDKLTSSLGDSHANLFPMQEAEKELKTQDTSTPTSAMGSEDADPDLFSWKTLKESSVQKQRQDEVFCSMSSKTWKEWVTSQRQEYSQRVKLARLTKGSECSSWPTMTVAGLVEGGIAKNVGMNTTGFWAERENGVRYGAKFRDAVIHMERGTLKEKNWPTPTCNEAEKAGFYSKGQMGQSLSAKALRGELWPTPTARDWKGCGNATPRKDGKSRLDTIEAVAKFGPPSQKNPNTSGKNQGQYLNPSWVEQLQGLEVGWTQLPTEWIG